MATGEHRLSFERPIAELESRLDKLERVAKESPETRNELQRLRRELADRMKRIYANLKPVQDRANGLHIDDRKACDRTALAALAAARFD